MADEDFEIDVYGDANEANDTNVEGDDSKVDDSNNHAYESNAAITIANGSNPDSTAHAHNEDYNADDRHEMDTRSTSATPAQGVKRKEGSDDRPIDPGATSALLLSELQWWTTDNDIRNWIRGASCEDEMKDITFSEHKVNGKSKGQAYVEFLSQQAATAVKRQVETMDSNQPGGKKITVIYTSHTTNPFKTLPKDAPARANKDGGSRGGSNMGGYNDRGNFRGRGNFNGPRGGFNRNFAGNNMGGGGFHGNVPGGFNNNMGGGNFGFNNGGGGGNFGFRGGMMPGGGMGGGMRGGGMRGGRGGGMNPGMNAGMSNGMMPGMGGMGMPMMGFQQPPHFNPAFFGGNQSSDWQNPHGAKRPREN
ncbi:uncharacterized protein F4822DRAFT_425783 [Hypoxylon trugodes]|uniref:uncharacterized protein n=1 Tax=Hypoxylon trugodes TaxID=326681 RepID=UPI002190350F|nr:uncharacterized protein F4822DRAFT_425783 [Hypoxylon trugodes]KAI1392581.1 hypothetical protein F4822DRAFT_425783 [Hypoxylon trugodes]